MAVIQHISKTAHLSVCTVLGQGLSPGQCCLVPLTLLCFVTKQADGMALVRVKHCRPSLYIKFHVDCSEVWFSSLLVDCALNLCNIMCHTNSCLTSKTRKMDVVRLLAHISLILEIRDKSSYQTSVVPLVQRWLLVCWQLISRVLVIVCTFCLHSPNWKMIATNGSCWVLCAWDSLLYCSDYWDWAYSQALVW